MKETVKKKIFLVLRLVVSFGLIGYIFYSLNAEGKLAELPDYFAAANYWWLLGAAILLLGLLAAGSFRWGMILSAQGIHLSWISVFMYYMMGMFFNNFLPSTVGGDFVKAYYLSKATGKTAGSFISVLVDRLMGMGGLCVVAVAACLLGGVNLWQNPETHLYALPIFLIVAGVTGGLGLFFLVVFNDRVMNLFLKLARRGKIGEKIKEFHQSMYVYKGHGKVLLLTLLISTLIWVVIVLVSWMVYMAFHTGGEAGSPGCIASIPIRYFYIFLPVISVIMSLPISFAGLGIREGVFIKLFDTLPGISDVDALILSLTFYFVFLSVSLLGGVIYIFKDRLRLHRDIIFPPPIKPRGGAEK
ncbi:MAG: lysylphosphatidylglycerol synthase transmembrane domain-containing protein [Candidatus Auribacterota bacterium]|nr:lysylphosphatidylglycerol synthase transmembrane domain-containing protein [Candidatus Auribacterota bacterium]